MVPDAQSQHQASMYNQSLDTRSSAITGKGPTGGVTTEMVVKEAKAAKTLPAVVQEVLAE